MDERWWVNTNAGICWYCREHARDTIMYVTNENYRYCINCRYDSRVYKRGQVAQP